MTIGAPEDVFDVGAGDAGDAVAGVADEFCADEVAAAGAGVVFLLPAVFTGLVFTGAG
jgi:hypothetical protein